MFVLFLFSTLALAQDRNSDIKNGQPLSSSSMKNMGCNNITRKICKSSKTGYCEAVYVNNPNASEACKNFEPQNIESVCGSSTAQLFDSDMECINPLQGGNCPRTIQEIETRHVEGIYQCLSIQKDLCREVCGARYDKIDVRNFYQTGRKPGLLCMDETLDQTKNGVNLYQDPSRASCLETHEGVMKWCINYNKSYNGIDLGAFVACAGRIP
jgi:hypothetical protein